MRPLRAALLALAAANATAYPTTTTDCRLEKVAVDFGAADFDATSGFAEASPVWLCCPLDEPEDTDLAMCSIVHGELVDGLADNDAKARVTLRSDGPPGLRARDLPAKKRGARKSFGGHAVLQPAAIERAAGARRLATATGGATFVDRTSFHGGRSVLSVIVGSAEALSGETRTWPNGADSCTEAGIAQLVHGRGGGVRFAIGGSPWAASASCRTAASDGVCLYNVADNLASVSRGAAFLDAAASHVIRLALVQGWPNDFCHWGSVWSAVKAALDADGRYDFRAYQHLAAFVPSHCAIGQGNLPGKHTINNICPGSGRYEHALTIPAHELGHNIGFHHGGFGTDEYGDRSSLMGSSVGDRASTVTLAHRRMFDWLPGLPVSLHLNTDEGTADLFDRTVELQLADVNREALPAGAVWGVEVHDGLTSWFVSYRGCTGYDWASVTGWCGVVQVSSRADGSTKSMHHATLQSAGDTFAFGTGGFATASLPSDVPLRADELTGTVAVTLRVDRGEPEPSPSPSPPPSPSPSPPPSPPPNSESWCRRQSGSCGEVNVYTQCTRTCGLCGDSSGTGASPSPPPPPSCYDRDGSTYCAEKLALCHRGNIRNGCELACGVCAPGGSVGGELASPEEKSTATTAGISSSGDAGPSIVRQEQGASTGGPTADNTALVVFMIVAATTVVLLGVAVVVARKRIGLSQAEFATARDVVAARMRRASIMRRAEPRGEAATAADTRNI